MKKIAEDMSSWDELNDYTFEEEQEKFNPKARMRVPSSDFNELFESIMEDTARARALADEFGIDQEIADYYYEVAMNSGSVQDFADTVIMDDEDEDSEYYCEVGIPYAELKELYKRIKG